MSFKRNQRVIVPMSNGAQGVVTERSEIVGCVPLNLVRWHDGAGVQQVALISDVELESANRPSPDHAARADELQKNCTLLTAQRDAARRTVARFQSSVRASRRSSAPQLPKDRRKSHGRRAKSKSKSKK